MLRGDWRSLRLLCGLCQDIIVVIATAHWRQPAVVRVDRPHLMSYRSLSVISFCRAELDAAVLLLDADTVVIPRSHAKKAAKSC